MQGLHNNQFYDRIENSTVGHNTEYRITFSIDKKLNNGEFLAIAGDIPALGEWKDFSMYPMQISNGDTWVSKRPLIVNTWVFK